MKPINDQNIKNIIKTTVKAKEINVTSQQILAKHEALKATPVMKKSLWSFPSFKLGLGFIATALVIGSLVYLSQGSLVPPITTTSTTTEPTTSTIEKEPELIPGGKEGEFVFMSYSALSYVPTTELNLTYYKHHHDSEPSQTMVNQTTLESVLNQTMPLVEDFYQIDNGFNYRKNQGVYIGTFGTYASEYILDENTRIIANVSFDGDDEETQTEIDGEIVIGENAYRYHGSQEIDLDDNQTDISLLIEYSQTSSLEIHSENQDNEQDFHYHLIMNNVVVFDLRIESYRHGQHHQRMVEVEVEKDNVDYYFMIEKTESMYRISYGRNLIIATPIGDNKYTYTY